jgi:hypothetical protein
MARARALPVTASRSERDSLLTQLLRARSFEALVKKHNGSIQAAQAALDALASNAVTAREREIASISGPSPNSRQNQNQGQDQYQTQDHRTSQGTV